MHAAAAVLVLMLLGPLAAAEPARTPSPGVRVQCDCPRFDAVLAEARAIYASRQEGVEMPLTPVMHDRYRARVDEAFAYATCLVGCPEVPELARNGARVLLAESGFKEASLGAGEWRARLELIFAETTRCLEIEPGNRRCMMWHAASRGVLARGSWNPLNLRLPAQLMAEFRSARGNEPPGRDLGDGSATRGEAAMLLKVPRFAGGDAAAGLTLIEQAAALPGFACRVSNRLVHAEAIGRTGDLPGAKRELAAIVAAGLPACGPERYENAMSLEEAARCLARLEALPHEDPGWDSDCRREVRAP